MLSPADFAAVAAIERLNWKEPPHKFNPKPGARPWGTVGFDGKEPLKAANHPDLRWTLSKIGGKVVGYALVDSDPARPEEAYLSDLGVHPDYRRRGVADRVLTRAIATAKTAATAKRLYLKVDPDNAAAIALYRKHGFRKAPGRPRPDGQVVMRLKEVALAQGRARPFSPATPR
jgi:ribosomal protein S18 acetylase RimI-like enzyme